MNENEMNAAQQQMDKRQKMIERHNRILRENPDLLRVLEEDAIELQKMRARRSARQRRWACARWLCNQILRLLYRR